MSKAVIHNIVTLFVTARNSSCRKVMLSQVRVKNSVHGGVCGKGLGGMCGRRDGHFSGQYASYWNAFLLFIMSFIMFFIMLNCDSLSFISP